MKGYASYTNKFWNEGICQSYTYEHMDLLHRQVISFYWRAMDDSSVQKTPQSGHIS